MKRILIIGNDCHANNYITTLLFNETLKIYYASEHDNHKLLKNYDKFGICNYILNGEDINNFDYIIYSTPLTFNDYIYQILKNYKGILLLEKMQIKYQLISSLKCKIYFIHLRDFDRRKKIKLKKHNYIEWPNLTDEGMDPLWHTVPNILDYFNSLISVKNDFKLVECQSDTRRLKIKLLTNNKILNIKIYKTEDKERIPIVNGVNIEWPNYYECISNLIYDLQNNRLRYKYSKNREKKYLKIIKEMDVNNMDLLKMKYSFNKNVIYKDRGEMLMAYNQESGDMYEFNSVGASIFKLLSQELRFYEVFESLNNEYGTTTSEIYEDVKQIVDRLIELNVVLIKEEKSHE